MLFTFSMNEGMRKDARRMYRAVCAKCWAVIQHFHHFKIRKKKQILYNSKDTKYGNCKWNRWHSRFTVQCSYCCHITYAAAGFMGQYLRVQINEKKIRIIMCHIVAVTFCHFVGLLLQQNRCWHSAFYFHIRIEKPFVSKKSNVMQMFEFENFGWVLYVCVSIVMQIAERSFLYFFLWNVLSLPSCTHSEYYSRRFFR